MSDFDSNPIVHDPKANARGLWRALAARESALIIAAAIFQLALVGWMIGGYTLLFRTSRVVLLQVVPVDPRDLLRGDYVILSYPFSRVPSHGIMGLPWPSKVDELDTWQRGSPVFVTLIPEADGVHYRGGLVNSEPPPPGTVYIQGTIQNVARIEFGIESFYVQEGQGKAYEEAVKQNQLWAEVALTSNGWGTVRGLRIEGDEKASSGR